MLLLLALGLPLIAAAGCIRYLYLSHPMGSGPAGPHVQSAWFAKSWCQRRVFLFGVGDGVTDGFGIRDDYTFFERLYENPPEEQPDMRGLCLRRVLPSLRIYNRAIAGSNSLHCLDKQLRTLRPQEPADFAIVVLTLGSVDLLRGWEDATPAEGALYGAGMTEAALWVRRFEARLHAIVARLHEIFPGGCHIFLGNLYDFTDGAGDVERGGFPAWEHYPFVLKMMNNAIAHCAESQDAVTLVDLHALFLGHGAHSTQPWQPHYDAEDPTCWLQANFEDPNDRGCDAIRRAYLIAIARFFGRE